MCISALVDYVAPQTKTYFFNSSLLLYFLIPLSKDFLQLYHISDYSSAMYCFVPLTVVRQYLARGKCFILPRCPAI